ncbi:hypothetical protein COLO4_05024 [Corchorus olitorius]|uniref:Uncharacterized protein n=1 Tax=Corchorus olitorius TaxID=93759 RepID=A0A1R3KS64_9ROSI|nr:hypothetical protein COLO4_05024 [Corchorus olitorius]
MPPDEVRKLLKASSRLPHLRCVTGFSKILQQPCESRDIPTEIQALRSEILAVG